MCQPDQERDMVASANEMDCQLRKDYQSLFPGQCGWEMAALYLLLAYDFSVRPHPGTEALDRLKYALMHALRWGCDAESRPLRSVSYTIDCAMFSNCREVLRRANEYTGVFGAFRLFQKGVGQLDSISNRTIQFRANPQWNAYDELDQQIQERSNCHRNRPETIAAGKRIVENVLRSYTDFQDYLPNINEFRSALPTVRHLAEEWFELPDSWSFDGIPISTLRKFWTALMLLGMVHRAVSFRLFDPQSPHLHHLMIRKKAHLIRWLSDVSDGLPMDRALVSRLVDLHTYDRKHILPDIALTPLLGVNEHTIAFSPVLVLSSRFERNFCAFAARNHRSYYDEATKALAPTMAATLGTAFEEVGMMVRPTVPIHTSIGNGDIDLFQRMWHRTGVRLSNGLLAG